MIAEGIAFGIGVGIGEERGERRVDVHDPGTTTVERRGRSAARMKLFSESTVMPPLSMSGTVVRPSFGTYGAGLVPVS